MKKILKCAAVLWLLFGFNSRFVTARAQGTAFTYQGQLMDTGSPANGSYDLKLELFATNSGGAVMGGPITNLATPVTNGLFTTTVDFGPGTFVGASNWLRISVRTNGGNSFMALSPRQQLTPAPYAIFAESASNLTGTISDGQLPAGVVSNNSVGVDLTGSFFGNGAGLNNVNAGALNGLTAGSFWQLGGNNVAGGQFIGSTNSQPVEIWAGGQRAMRFEPFSFGAPNVIGGSPVNYVSNGIYGAVIGGGGIANFFGSATSNSVLNYFGTVGGGAGNTASGSGATVSGGVNNVASGQDSFVGGGSGDGAPGQNATVAGGNANNATGNYDTIGGGNANNANHPYSFVGGGQANTAGGNSDVVAGGATNTATGLSTTVGGGQNNSATANSATVAGGNGNSASGQYSSVAGGLVNSAGGLAATVAGGSLSSASGGDSTVSGGAVNYAPGDYSAVGGGANNVAGGTSATVAGGDYDNASGDYSLVGGGYGNASSGLGSTVGGGFNNLSSGDSSTVAGGYTNYATGAESTVGGGEANVASEFVSTVSGGFDNAAPGYSSTVGGGWDNYAAGGYATVPGGYENAAYGTASFAAGFLASAYYDNTFVWSDGSSNPFYFEATGPDQFLIQATGGVGINLVNPTGDALSIGGTTRMNNYNIYFRAAPDQNHGVGYYGDATSAFAGVFPDGPVLFGYSGGALGTQQNGSEHIALQWTTSSVTVNGTFNNNSDREAKQDFAPVRAAQILDKVAQLPISTWRYKADAGTPHIGPMAQDFYSAFSVGTDEKHIAPIDEGGVALAAIQGLNQKLDAKDATIQAQAGEIADLKARLEKLEQLLSRPAGAGASLAAPSAP